ncbi:ATP-binding protein [bacterium]|nr:ATP-binding protein [bacterium]
MNPFRFGTIVTGTYFVNRVDEIKQITSDIKANQHIILISPRRYGKSSLINRVIEENKITSFHIDLELITDEIDLANFYVRKALSLSRFEKMKHYLKNLRVQPSIQIQPEKDEISISFSAEDKNVSALLSDSLELPEIIAKNMKKKIAIIFDEFQEIRRISPMLEKKMRGIFQHHQNVTYIFIGSQESMIREIFQDRNNPFYKFGRQMVLNKIPESEFLDFIVQQFKLQQIDAEGIAKDILRFTDCHPYYTQQLCHEIYILNEDKTLKIEIIEKAVNQITTEHHSDYSQWWNNLDNTERKVIIGIASGEHNHTSRNFIKKYGIKSSSTSSSAVGRLINSGVIVKKRDEGFEIEDPFWRVWILKNREQ